MLTVTEYGYGKRSSSYDFRATGRGGKGIRATDVSKTAEIGQLVAAFPVGNDDQIMLVSDGGQLIRVPVDGIRIASRATKGVTIFNTAEGEKVVSVERISEPQGEDVAPAAADDAPAPDVLQPVNPRGRELCRQVRARRRTSVMTSKAVSTSASVVSNWPAWKRMATRPSTRVWVR